MLDEWLSYLNFIPVGRFASFLRDVTSEDTETALNASLNMQSYFARNQLPVATKSASLAIDEIKLTTPSVSLAPSRTYTIFDGSGQLFKFGVTGADLKRYAESLKLAGTGAYGKFSPIMPKYQANVVEKYLRGLQYNSTEQ